MHRSLRAAVLVAVLTTTACTGTSVGTEAPGGRLAGQLGTARNGIVAAADRKPLPTLEGTTLQGARLSLADMRGKVVVLNVWASWCPPCRAEAPNLNEVYQRTHASGVEFVGLNVKDESGPALGMEKGKGVPYPSIADEDGVLLLKFAGTAPQVPPTTLVIDRQGRVAARFIGAVTVSELLAPVQQLAAEKA